MNETTQPPVAVASSEGLGAWVPTADTARLPDFDVPVWLYDAEGYAYIGCRVYEDDGWLWAKCYCLPYVDKSGEWKVVDAEVDDDYSPVLWQPMPEVPRYTQAELEAAADEARRLVADIRVE